MEQNRFLKIMSSSSSYNNINGIEDSKGKNMSFEKINDQPGIGQLQIRDNNYIKKYMFSDHPILNEMRTRRKKRKTLKKRLERFLIPSRKIKKNKIKKNTKKRKPKKKTTKNKQQKTKNQKIKNKKSKNKQQKIKK